MTAMVLPGLPFSLEASGNPPCRAEAGEGGLLLACGPASGLFIDPAAEESRRPDAGRWTGLPDDEDFTLSARVSVRFASPFDAGALLLYLSERRWATLCYELSPRGVPAVVSVVTRATSDECGSFETGGGPLRLRIARAGRAWTFHAADEGAGWRRLRYFSLGEASGARVGFMAQSPRGGGCTAVFDDIVYKPGAPADVRDGG